MTVLSTVVSRCINALDTDHGPVLTTLIREYSEAKENTTTVFQKWKIANVAQEHKEKIAEIVKSLERTKLHQMVDSMMRSKWCSIKPNECENECKGFKFSVTKSHLLSALLLSVVPRLSKKLESALQPLLDFEAVPGELLKAEIRALRETWDGFTCRGCCK